MTTRSFATELRDTIRSIRDEQGVTEIKCDNLIAYLKEIIDSPDEEIAPAQMEKYKAELQLWIKQNEAAQASGLEMFRTVILAGQNALKTAFLMNGGATVALLAFLGKLSDQHQDKIAIFSSSLIVFVFGVLAITLASGSTYLSQAFFAAGSKSWEQKTGFWLNILTIAFCLSSYGLFIWGAIRAYKAFTSFA
jgi:ABC-type multidrug transport system permease subunit